MNRLVNIFIKTSALLIVCVVMLGVVSCSDLWSEQHPGTYYTSTGQTVADHLEQDESGRFSEFLRVLKKAQIYGELDTYGKYTCFAPTNNAFAEYLADKGIPSIDSLSKADCDTIAWNHLIRGNSFFMSDVTSGSLPGVNLLNRFLVVGYIADTPQSTGIHA